MADSRMLSYVLSHQVVVGKSEQELPGPVPDSAPHWAFEKVFLYVYSEMRSLWNACSDSHVQEVKSVVVGMPPQHTIKPLH